MVGLIIATHGNTSIELQNSLEMFSGKPAQCRTWKLNPGDDMKSKEEQLQQYVREVDSGDGVLIMTDLFGGTPANLALKISVSENVQVLTGVNLPMLIQFMSAREVSEMDELIGGCMEEAVQGIKCPSKSLKREVFK